MKTIQIKIYKFAELSQSAQENAIQNCRELNYDFYWGDDYIESAKKCLELFDCYLADWSIDWSNINCSHWKIKCADVEDLQEFLNQYLPYIKDEKSVTGFCADYDFFKPIRHWFSKPYDIDFDELMNDCVYECINAGCKDYDYQISDEGLIEYIDANALEFTKEGDLY